MMLTRFTPFREISRLDPWRDFGVWPADFVSMMRGSGEDGAYPRFDVMDKDDAYEIKADLPGVKRDDIQVLLDGNDLEIVADFSEEDDKHENGERVRSERMHGRVRRRLVLAEEPDMERASAAYEDGVLKITLPKSRKKDAVRKRLEVH